MHGLLMGGTKITVVHVVSRYTVAHVTGGFYFWCPPFTGKKKAAKDSGMQPAATQHARFQNQIQLARNLFQYKPTMDTDQMMTVLRLLGADPRHTDMVRWVKQVDREGSGKLTVPDALLLLPRNGGATVPGPVNVPRGSLTDTGDHGPSQPRGLPPQTIRRSPKRKQQDR